MAELPDIDTTQVSFIAYWNALEHGVTNIEPSDALSYGQIQEQTLYDNGVDGILKQPDSTGYGEARDIQFRIKDDGWFVAWLDRTENYNTQIQNLGSPDFKTPADILNWGVRATENNALTNPTRGITNNQLERSINGLQAQLDNSGQITYSANDVALYGYHVTDGSTVSFLSYEDARDGFESVSTAEWQYLSSTDFERLSYHGMSSADGSTLDGYVRIDESGTFICSVGGSYGGYYGREAGSVDVLNSTLASNADTVYGLTVSRGNQVPVSVIVHAVF